MGKKIELNAAGKMISVAKAIGKQFNTDGWLNVLTGLGRAGKDSRIGHEVCYRKLTETEVERLFAGDDVARRVVSYPSEEGTREWIRVMRSTDEGSPETPQDIMDFLESLDAQNKFQEAWEWARLYGGSGVFLAVDDGKELVEPLDLGQIREIKALNVLSRYELQPLFIDRNLESDRFGKPMIYQLTPRIGGSETGEGDNIGGSTQIHYTRIIEFQGARLPRRLQTSNQYWSDSILTALFSALRSYNLAHDSLSSAITDFKVGILKLQNLADMVASDQDQALMARINIMNQTKSVLSSIVLDAESETYEKSETTFTGIKEAFEQINQRLVAATGLPHTIIFGEGSTGNLSGAGESEDKNVKDYVAALQKRDLTKPINRLIEVSMASRKGPTNGKILENITWEFMPLWQLDEKTKAEVHETQSRADLNYWNMGALSASEISLSRFSGDEFNTETTIDVDARVEEDLNGSSNSNAGSGKETEGGSEGNFDGLPILDKIEQTSKGFMVLSKSGKHLAGPYKSREDAKKKLEEIERLSNKGK